jgi:hypothetical protein
MGRFGPPLVHSFIQHANFNNGQWCMYITFVLLLQQLPMSPADPLPHGHERHWWLLLILGNVFIPLPWIHQLHA